MALPEDLFALIQGCIEHQIELNKAESMEAFRQLHERMYDRMKSKLRQDIPLVLSTAMLHPSSRADANSYPKIGEATGDSTTVQNVIEQSCDALLTTEATSIAFEPTPGSNSTITQQQREGCKLPMQVIDKSSLDQNNIEEIEPDIIEKDPVQLFKRSPNCMKQKRSEFPEPNAALISTTENDVPRMPEENFQTGNENNSEKAGNVIVTHNVSQIEAFTHSDISSQVMEITKGTEPLSTQANSQEAQSQIRASSLSISEPGRLIVVKVEIPDPSCEAEHSNQSIASELITQPDDRFNENNLQVVSSFENSCKCDEDAENLQSNLKNLDYTTVSSKLQCPIGRANRNDASSCNTSLHQTVPASSMHPSTSEEVKTPTCPASTGFNQNQFCITTKSDSPQTDEVNKLCSSSHANSPSKNHHPESDSLKRKLPIAQSFIQGQDSSLNETTDLSEKPKREPIRAPSPLLVRPPKSRYRQGENHSKAHSQIILSNEKPSKAAGFFIDKTPDMRNVLTDARESIIQRSQRKGFRKGRPVNDSSRFPTVSNERNEHPNKDHGIMARLGLTRTVSVDNPERIKKRRISTNEHANSHSSNSENFYVNHVPNPREDHFDRICKRCNAPFNSQQEFERHIRTTGHGSRHWPPPRGNDLRNHLQSKRINSVADDNRSSLNNSPEHEQFLAAKPYSKVLPSNAKMHSHQQIHSVHNSNIEESPCSILHSTSSFDGLPWENSAATHFDLPAQQTRSSEFSQQPRKYVCNYDGCTYCTLDLRDLKQHEFAYHGSVISGIFCMFFVHRRCLMFNEFLQPIRCNHQQTSLRKFINLYIEDFTFYHYVLSARTSILLQPIRLLSDSLVGPPFHLFWCQASKCQFSMLDFHPTNL